MSVAAYAPPPEQPRWPKCEALAREVAVLLRDKGPQRFRVIIAYLPPVSRSAAMDAVAWLDLNGWAAFDHSEARTWGLTLKGRHEVRGAASMTWEHDASATKPTRSGNPRGKPASAETRANCAIATAWLIAHPWSETGQMWRAQVFTDRRTLDYTIGYLSKTGVIVSRKRQGLVAKNLYAMAGTKAPRE